jgi:hypothetical protein
MRYPVLEKIAAQSEIESAGRRSVIEARSVTAMNSFGKTKLILRFSVATSVQIEANGW